MDWPVCNLQVCNLVFNKIAQAEYQKVNKHPKFDADFDIRRQLQHFEYDMNRTLVKGKRILMKLGFFMAFEGFSYNQSIPTKCYFILARWPSLAFVSPNVKIHSQSIL